MSEIILDPLEEVIRKAGEGWLIDWHKPSDQALPHLRKILSDANDWGKQKFAGNAPTLTPDAIVNTFAKNPHKVRAFLQVIGSVGSPKFLVMVWRILQGMNIQAVKLQYESDKPFFLSVRLESPYGETEEYESHDIDDAVVLRHLGTMKMGAQGMYDGFYAINISKP